MPYCRVFIHGSGTVYISAVLYVNEDIETSKVDLNFAANSAIAKQQMLGRDRERCLTISTTVIWLWKIEQKYFFQLAIFLNVEQQFTGGAIELIHSFKNPKVP